MSFETMILWFSFMVPLLFSPGPANITVSSLAGSFGLKKTLGFIGGISLWNFVVCLIVGLSFGVIHSNFDRIFHIIEILGSFYIFYLAYTFYKNSQKQMATGKFESDVEEPSFLSGLLMQTLNGKLYPVLSLMFSQFLDSHNNIYTEVFVLTLMFVFLCVAVYLFWGLLGAKLFENLDPKKKKLQMQLSALLLVIVGISLLKNSILFS